MRTKRRISGSRSESTQPVATTSAPAITNAPGGTTTTSVGDTTATTIPGEATATTLAPPVGGVDSGGGSTSGAQNMGVLIGGFALAVAAGAFLVGLRLQDRRSD